MATVGRTFSIKDDEDDGPTALRDFPPDCVSVSRRLQENTNRPVEATNRGGKLSDNFRKLSPRDQFLERCCLFDRLRRIYSHYMNRPDLEAMKRMNNDLSSFKFEGIGSVPGVEVGDTFDYRAEMYVVGLHRVQEAGIACVILGNEMIACSVVVSGGYPDNDCGEVIEYTGVGKKGDQKLEAGNKGLRNSHKQEKPVRVIRGRNVGRTQQEILGLSRKITPYKKYSYDGLYDIVGYEFVEGTEGHKVYKFLLIRQPGQPALDMNRVGSVGGQRRNH